MDKIDLTRTAIMCIHKDFVTHIPKQENLNYHIHYFLLLSKIDPVIKEVLTHYNVGELLLNPSGVNNTINFELARKGICLFLNMGPQVYEPTNCMFAYLPDYKDCNEFQRKELEKYLDDKLTFYDLALYDSDKKTLISILDEENFVENNTFILKDYITESNTHAYEKHMILERKNHKED